MGDDGNYDQNDRRDSSEDVIQLGDLERCALRPGNVHSADGWRRVLEPVIVRYRGAVKHRYFRGDEANLQVPLAGFWVVNAEAEYEISKTLRVYVEAENILDQRYATFGLYGDPTGGGAFPQFTNPRFIVPAQPFGGWVGIRAEL